MTSDNKQQPVDEQLLLSAAKQTLEESVKNIDRETLDRLAAIRLRAVKAAAIGQSKRRSWLTSGWLVPAGGFVTAAILVVSVMLWSAGSMNEMAPVAAIEDITILTDSEDLEFYKDLEFYQWLAVHEQAVS